VIKIYNIYNIMATQLKNIKISTAQDRDGSGISDTSTVENRPVDKPYG
jgi:hypothetical protein